MATLLDLLSALPEGAMREGASVGAVDGQGRKFTVTFGKPVPAEVSSLFRVEPTN